MCANFAILCDIECATISGFARETVKRNRRMPTLRPTLMRTLIFDLDGTLSDPMPGFSRSINHALVSSGFQPCREPELARYVGPDVEATFRALTGAPDSGVRMLVRLYRERYESLGFSENALYPGITAALDTFSRHGVQLGVCTSRRLQMANRILRTLEVRDRFYFVSGGNAQVTKQQQLSQLLAADVIDSTALMIGDRAGDLLGAHANGLRSAGVLWGYGSRSELQAQSPLRLLERVGDLTDLLSQ
jgi:phosphoglycolate phosphatase